MIDWTKNCIIIWNKIEVRSYEVATNRNEKVTDWE